MQKFLGIEGMVEQVPRQAVGDTAQNKKKMKEIFEFYREKFFKYSDPSELLEKKLQSREEEKYFSKDPYTYEDSLLM